MWTRIRVTRTVRTISAWNCSSTRSCATTPRHAGQPAGSGAASSSSTCAGMSRRRVGPYLGPPFRPGFLGADFGLPFENGARLALPRALGRRQLLLESVPLSAEPIPLGCQARSLVLQAVPLVLHASDLRGLLRTVAAQPSVGVLELFDAFPGRAAEDSHPRDDSRRQGFCPGLAEKPNVSAGSDPLFNYSYSRCRQPQREGRG